MKPEISSSSQEKKSKKSVKSGFVFFGIIFVIYLLTFFISPEKSILAGQDFLKTFFSFLPILFAMLFVMELVKIYIHKKDLISLLKKTTGINRVFAYMGAGIFSMGSLYLWYPLLVKIKESGASHGDIATFIYARAIKPIYFPVLFFYFDWKYIASLFVSLIFFSVIQGVVIDKIMKK